MWSGFFFMDLDVKISAVIIAKNEQDFIGKCIKSLLGVADQIIVIDSHSTDNTKSIANSLGANVITKEWDGYAATKNFGNDQANHPWILSIDADEFISPELRSAILAEKKKGLADLVVFKWNRLNNYCGTWIKHGGWYPDAKIRLFQKTNTRWIGKVHETLEFEQPVTEQWIAGDLLHYTVASQEDHLARLIKYNKLAIPYANKFRAGLAAITTFLRMYVLKLGFLDGIAGFHLCRVSAKGKWLRV